MNRGIHHPPKSRAPLSHAGVVALARQTLDRLSDSVAKVLESMGAGLQETWSIEQTEAWRRQARVTRGRRLGGPRGTPPEFGVASVSRETGSRDHGAATRGWITRMR